MMASFAGLHPFANLRQPLVIGNRVYRQIQNLRAIPGALNTWGHGMLCPYTKIPTMAGIPQDLRAPANGIFNLHLKLFTLPSNYDFLRSHQL